MSAWLRRVRLYEPAKLRAVYVAIVGLAGTLGLSIPAGVDGRIVTGLAAFSVAFPYLQALWTRKDVTPNQRVEEIRQAALYSPVPDQARRPPEVPS